jgi:hypothetical protein
MGIKLTEMSTDILWNFREKVGAELARKVRLEAATLDDHLKKINSDRAARPHPKDRPKYQNPEDPTEPRSGLDLPQDLILRRQGNKAP